MMSTSPNSTRFDLAGLANAVASGHESDALRCPFDVAQWDILASYLQPVAIVAGQVLIKKGALDRSVYFIERGVLSVHYEDEKERLRMVMVSAGTVVGEGSFFSHLPRRATVTATAPGQLWCLSPMRYTELLNRHCALAHALTMDMGAVMAKRLYHRLRRVAVT
jgi:CRP/FNR family transcriptional regulator, cyclic AMP receptor protein